MTTRQLVGTIIGLQVTLLLAALDQTIVSTAMPRIIAQLNGFDRYAWVTAAYMLTSTTAVPIFGKLSDMYGRKYFLLGGAVLFVLSSALCGLAGYFPLPLGDGMNQLILFRGIQGIASGIIMGLVFTVIGDIFPPGERGKYQGLFSGVWAFSSIIGPALGGWITDCLNWRWVFYVNVPVGAIAVAVLYFAFPYFRPHARTRTIDYAGLFSFVGFIVPLLLALTWVAQAGWTSPPVVGALTIAAFMLVAFLVIEKRAIEPIIPLSLFANSIVSISCLSLVLMSMSMFGAILFLPLFMQSVIGLSATASGSLLTPMMLSMTVFSLASGQLISRVGRYRAIAVCALSIMCCGMWLLSRMDSATTQWICVRNMMVIGSGLGLLMPIYTIVVQNVAPPNMIGSATAATQFFRSIGGTLGAAVFGSIMLSRYTYYFMSKLPPGVSPQVLSAFKNPLRLAQTRGSLGTLLDGSPASEHLHTVLLGNVREALSYSIGGIFWITLWITVFAWALNWFLKEMPLRKTHHASIKVPDRS